jgi:zinc transporter, ZIP family
MSDFEVFLALTAAFAFSIFLALPVVYSKHAQGSWGVALNAVAIGILVFLLADIWGDVAPIVYPSGYVANGMYSLAFVVAFISAFLALYAVENLPRRSPALGGSNARTTASMIALAIGLQNLTEGLVFGVNWTAGAVGFLLVIFMGFFLQNVTEGFPIASPFLGTNDPRGLPMMVGLFLVGGLPTLLGGAIGYYWSSSLFLVIFDSLAIGAIAYAILPMLRVAFRPLATKDLSVARNKLVCLGVGLGFTLGFLVNAV